MSYKTLTVNTINKVCTMKFNQPDKLNAFDTQMVLETQDALNQIAKDTGIKALIITGEGKGFSAGADLSDSSGIDDPVMTDWFMKVLSMDTNLHFYKS